MTKGRQAPILIYQMGKVGSSSIVAALARQRIAALHLHALNPHTLATIKARCQTQGVAPPAHVREAQKVLDTWIEPRTPLQIITAVRDPIARNISAYFENLDFFWPHKLGRGLSRLERWSRRFLSRFPRWRSAGAAGAATFSHTQVDAAIQDFLVQYPASVPLRWFDREVKEVLGIDVYTHPFPTTVGAQVIQEQGMRLLILRAETPDAMKMEAIREFLKLPTLSLSRTNRTAQKPHHAFYRAFVERIHFSEAYLDRMYMSQYMRHFYTAEEITQFREEWIRRPLNSEGDEDAE